MKQTNNAIKFLVAQYRAIYQSAYLKGVASAIIVTASLAATQAQAVTSNFDGATSGGTISISADSDVLEITSDTRKDDIPFTVKISTGKSAINKVDGATVSAKKATFEISSEDTQLKVSASTGPSAASASLTIGTLDVKKGNVHVEANDTNSATLAASQINVGNGGKITAQSAVGTTVASTIGDTSTRYNLKYGSTIILGASGSMLGQSLVSDGGKIFLNGGTLRVPAYYQNSDTSTAQKLDLDISATSSITLSNSGEALGVLDLASGSTIDIKAGQSANELKITSNANSKGSVVVLQDGVSLKSSLNGNTVGGVISVSGAAGAGGGAASNSELHLTAKTLGEFLAPGDTANNAAGQLVLDANSTLKFTNDSSVDISADTTNKDGTSINVKAANTGGGTAPSGSVIVKGEATISGKKITISKSLGAGLDSNLNVQADELTLGNTSSHTNTSAGAKSLTAKNVKFVDSGTFVLADDITLSNLADASKKTAQKGTLTGPVVISGRKAITVDGGLYTSTGDITISGGAVKVHNTRSATRVNDIS